ncbi:putative membrane protein YczE [Paenibacillus sp. J23TS9]|uniref:YczE/YyaS/YitT family protein n=1 Tax=Paenibacillus sp. J23TS9 TaxID=2807193 RepID=UPI001B0EE81C|nr:YitT family protein [Paenibacillus sp. J23TS9]GIP26215.1 putative membrane protein YczE [Paenibacillus sp. J23TS9]
MKQQVWYFANAANMVSSSKYPRKHVIIYFSRILLRVTLFLLGLMIMSYGIVLIVEANLGAAPWDVMHLGIVRHWGFTFGRTRQMVGIIIIVGSCFVLRKWPSIGIIANMLLVGEFCNYIINWHLTPDIISLTSQITAFASGLFIWGLGTGIYIQSQLGAGPRDLLMLALHHVTGISIRWVRTLIEITTVLVGISLGGPFSWGTLVFSVTIGHTTELGMKLAKKWFGKVTG